MKKSFFSRKATRIGLGLILLVIIGGAIFLLTKKNTPPEEEGNEIQTSKVRTGDLMISAGGSGTVFPAAQVELGFRSSGVISEVYVTTNQKVKTGDVLAVLENAQQQVAFDQAEANMNNLFLPATIAAYQIETMNAESAYNDVLEQYNGLDMVVGTTDTIAIMQSSYITAEEKVQQAEENLIGYSGYPDDDPDKIRAAAALAEAKINLSIAGANLDYYSSTLDEISAATIKANLEIANAKLEDARTALTIVQSGDIETLKQALSAADNTLMAKLKKIYLDYENALIALENTKMIAPFDGVVVNLEMVPGQLTGNNPLLTLAALDTLQVKFYMDETDLAGLKAGNRVIYTFNAYPESNISGEVTLIESVLQTIDGSPAAVVWGSILEEPSFDILAGMTVDVEVIAGEVEGALIIPVQALRELTPNSYAVFIVKSDGSLELTPVTIGLRDFANVEITSGLKAGDIISTGTIETNDGN